MVAIFEAASEIEGPTFEIDKTGQLPSGTTLAGSGSTIAAFDKFERDVTSTILASGNLTVSVPDDTVRFTVKTSHKPAGKYRLRLTYALSAGSPIVEDALLFVRETFA